MGGFSAVIGLAIITAFAIVLLVTIGKSFLFIGRPNEILVFSGRDNTLADGSKAGFRYVIGERTFRIPLLETVQQMDLRTIPVSIHIEGAYSKGGIPLSVHAIANVKISKEPHKVRNAIERFLGRDRAEISRVAQETLEGNLRGVLATMTPEQVNEDRLRFVDELQKDVEPDFEKLGLHLDTLKIQSVSDDRDYLDSIGRKRIAEIIKQAEVAESNAMKEAEEVEAEQQGRSEVARREAQAQIQKAQNELRGLTANLELNAKSEEEKSQARALAARAEAEQELQKVRTDLEKIRLEADVVIPARVDRIAREYLAAGEAAEIAEKGRATAAVLSMMGEVWVEAGDAALDVFMLNRLEEIMQKVAEAARQVEVREVALIDSGDGTSLPNYVSSFPKIVSSIFDEMRDTVGIDIAAAIQGNDDPDSPAAKLTGNYGKFPQRFTEMGVGRSAEESSSLLDRDPVRPAIGSDTSSSLEDSLRNVAPSSSSQQPSASPAQSAGSEGAPSDATRPSFASLQRQLSRRNQQGDDGDEG
ncbi:MAG: SPFH domain-containing protein [Myxococcota bacterium]|jgi:flotillin|nr:SPFH domain-containing protein [Myxococcota bacterium]